MGEQKYPNYGLYFRRYAPFATFGMPSFEGDKRTGASTSLKVTSRTYGCVMFNPFEIVNGFVGTSGTHYHALLYGDIVGHSKVSGTHSRTRLVGPGLIEFEASSAGGNPLIPGAPDIDTYLIARFDFGFGSPRLMRISGEVCGDNFPNLEVFLLCYRTGNTALLIDGRTTGGRRTGPITRLAGGHRKQSLGRLSGTLILKDNFELSMSYTTAPSTI
jgi:hypothetical protein